MRDKPFTRPTILSAIELLGNKLGQAHFNQLVLRLSLEEEITSDTTVAVVKKAALLGRAVMRNQGTTVATLDGTISLAEAVVREAVATTRRELDQPGEPAFVRGLALDGYVIDWESRQDGTPLLRAALPSEIDLPAADDEVHCLLKEFGFTTPLGHLDQAIEAHTRGDWAAANSQARTFLEGLLDTIAAQLRPDEVPVAGGEARRALLGRIGFLSAERNEWTADGKNYINGLFKMLHTEGSHPGLSNDDRSTFRLHLILITARTFLRRLKYGR